MRSGASPSGSLLGRMQPREGGTLRASRAPPAGAARCRTALGGTALPSGPNGGTPGGPGRHTRAGASSARPEGALALVVRAQAPVASAPGDATRCTPLGGTAQGVAGGASAGSQGGAREPAHPRGQPLGGAGARDLRPAHGELLVLRQHYDVTLWDQICSWPAARFSRRPRLDETG